jgi:hypothetical protein
MKGKGREVGHVAANERSGPLEEDEEGGEVEEGEEEEEEDPGPSMTTNSITKSKKSKKKKNKQKRKKQKALQRDMYKLFDGSALMLLGTSHSSLLLPIRTLTPNRNAPSTPHILPPLFPTFPRMGRGNDVRGG